MNILVIIYGLLVAGEAFSREHSLAAHEHGRVKLAIVVEKNLVDIDLDGPSESFIGFEYLPKTLKEKEIFNETKDLWEKNLFNILTFDKKLGCKIREADFKQIIGKKDKNDHSEVEAKASVLCSENPSGSNLIISLKKVFKNIKKLTVEFIGVETKSLEITRAIDSVKI